jgi:hypothetical protein
MNVFLQVQKNPGSKRRRVDKSKDVLQDEFMPLKSRSSSNSGMIQGEG